MYKKVPCKCAGSANCCRMTDYRRAAVRFYFDGKESYRRLFLSVFRFGFLIRILYNFYVKQFMVGANEAGQRVDRLVSRLLPKASYGEVQKLFRKKCFKLNHSRGVKPADFVRAGDLLEVYLSDDSLCRLGADYLLREGETPDVTTKLMTIPDKTRGSIEPKENGTSKRGKKQMPRQLVGEEPEKLLETVGASFVFENEEILVVSKPAGMLTQGDQTGDVSMTDIVKQYLSDYCTPFFSPATASRLDRGTSGILVFSKNYDSLKRLNAEMRTGRAVRKYLCVVHGYLEGEGFVEGMLTKDTKNNRVELSELNHETRSTTLLSNKGVEALFETGAFDMLNEGKSREIDRIDRITERGINEQRNEKAKVLSEKGRVGTFYRVLFHSKDKRYTLVEAELVTGKTHQIRVSMAAVGHPIVGDAKYGRLSNKSVVKNQLLHAYRVEAMERVFISKAERIADFLGKYF